MSDRRSDRPVVRRAAAAAAAIAAALLTVVVAPGAAHAANNGSFAVEPTSPAGSITPRQYFIYTVAAGGEVKDSVSVTNLTGTPQQFTVYGADGFTTAKDGALGLHSLGDKQSGVGAWITMSVTALKVPAHTVARIPFVMKVPAGAASGDHVGAVVALDAAVTAGSATGPDVGVQKAVAARVYARVSGPTQAGLSVTDVRLDRSHSPALVHYTLTDTGNVRLAPTADITVNGLVGGRLQVLTKQLPDDLLPGQSTEYTQAVRSLPRIDYLSVTVVASTDQVSARGTAHVLLIPWWLIVLTVFAVLLIIALLCWWFVCRRRRTRRQADGPVPVPA